jgi:CRP-like cAMP-binding protein
MSHATFHLYFSVFLTFLSIYSQILPLFLFLSPADYGNFFNSFTARYYPFFSKKSTESPIKLLLIFQNPHFMSLFSVLTFFTHRGTIIVSQIIQFTGVVPLSLTQKEVALLGRCPLLRGVPEQELLQLVQAEGASLSRFSVGQTVYSPQQFHRCLGVVLSGQLRVTKGTLTVSLLEPGDLFGAAALYYDGGSYAATLTAKRPSRCLLLDQQLMDRLLAENAQIRENYLRYLTSRIHFLSARLQSLAQSGAEGKLARYLLAHHGEGVLTCSATDLAQRLGISRATLYRAFEGLEARGLICREGKTIRIPSQSALEGALTI